MSKLLMSLLLKSSSYVPLVRVTWVRNTKCVERIDGVTDDFGNVVRRNHYLTVL